MPLRVVLADDGALFRQALADLLGRAGIQVLAQAGNAPLLLRAVEEHQPEWRSSTSGCRPPTPRRASAPHA